MADRFWRISRARAGERASEKKRLTVEWQTAYDYWIKYSDRHWLSFFLIFDNSINWISFWRGTGGSKHELQKKQKIDWHSSFNIYHCWRISIKIEMKRNESSIVHSLLLRSSTYTWNMRYQLRIASVSTGWPGLCLLSCTMNSYRKMENECMPHSWVVFSFIPSKLYTSFRVVCCLDLFLNAQIYS